MASPKRPPNGALLAATLVLTLLSGGSPVAATLDGPEVYKLDWNTRALRLGDLDANGYPDLVLLNNERARIDFLYQYAPGETRKPLTRAGGLHRWQPVLDDARFRRSGLTTGQQMYALALGDLDGDGRQDLAVTTDQDGLVVYFQTPGDTPESRWTRRWSYQLEPPSRRRDSLMVADLDHDGDPELVMLADKALLVFHRDPHGGFESPQRYPFAAGQGYAPIAVDVDGDGLDDLFYLTPKQHYALRLRLQRADGHFGPEHRFRLKTPRGTPVLLAQAADSGVRLATLQADSGMLETLDVAASGASSGNPAGDPSKTLTANVATTAPLSPAGKFEPAILAHALPTNAAGASSFVLADMDGDGREDLLFGEPKGSSVWFYRQRADGDFDTGVAFPSFAEPRMLAAGDIDRDGRTELLVASSTDGVLGSATLTDGGRLSYPQPIAIDGIPLAQAVMSSQRDAGFPRLAVVVRRAKKRLLLNLAQDADGNWQPQQALKLDGLRTDPTGLMAADLDHDGRQDLVLFVARAPARVFLGRDQGKLIALSGGDGFRSGLLNKLHRGALSLGDTDGDGQAEILVAGKGFARALQIDPKGQLSVLDQFNARDADTLVASALPLDLDGDDQPELLLFPKGGDELELLRRDASGVYRHVESVPVGNIELLATTTLAATDRVPRRILYLGRKRFWVLPIGKPRIRVEVGEHFETTLEDVDLWRLAGGDLDGDGSTELVAMDNRDSRVIEVLQHEQDAWNSVLHFAVFDTHNGQEQRGTGSEPREMLIGEATGDDRQDLLLLVHDRVLLYPGK